MNSQVCMSAFYFSLLIGSLVALLVYGVYSYNVSMNNSQNNKDAYVDVPTTLGAPINYPLTHPPESIVDDLYLGNRPPRRRDYRKFEDPLQEPTRRYVNYPDHVNYGGNVNIPTQGYRPSYQIMGYLNNKKEGPDRMLKLYGRRVDTYRYEYYAMHHDDPTLKIPLHKTNGDRELFDGDTVKVPGYMGKFKVHLYDYEAPTYIPTLY